MVVLSANLFFQRRHSKTKNSRTIFAGIKYDNKYFSPRDVPGNRNYLYYSICNTHNLNLRNCVVFQNSLLDFVQELLLKGNTVLHKVRKSCKKKEPFPKFTHNYKVSGFWKSTLDMILVCIQIGVNIIYLSNMKSRI